MTPQELKNSILQLAIQGRLVEQRPEEGTAEELYKQIQAEKKELIKAGKIKRGKTLPEITEDEIPFEIPESWKWVCLGALANINGGYAFKSTDYSLNGVRVIRISDFNESGFINNKIVRHPFTKEFEPFLLEEKNILLCMTGGTVGKSLFVTKLDETMMVNQRVATIKTTTVLPEYINYNILAPLIQIVIQHSKNSTNDNISMETIKAFPIPLPPLAEQKRIVAKIEELLPLIDRYEAAWSRLENFNKRFPGDMQKSILQMAIQGKLVEQRPEEGTGEELYKQIQAEKQELIKTGKIKRDRRTDALSTPQDEDFPFDIPDTWKWVYLGSILKKLTDGTHKTPKYSTNGVKFVSVKDISSGILSLNNTKYITISEHEGLFKRCDPVRGDMLLSKVGTTGVPAVVDTDEPFSLFVSVALLKYSHDFIDELFLYYLLKSPLVQMQAAENTRGVGNKNWVLDAIAKTKIVLPPLAEQKRIVARLKELLPLCKKLQQ